MPLDAEFRNHLHDLMVETSGKFRDEISKHERQLLWEAQQTHNAAALPNAYSKARIYAFRTRVEATIAKYFDALETCDIEVDSSVEQEMLQIIRKLTRAAQPLQLPPALNAPNSSAVQRAHTMELARVGNLLYLEAANRLREAKIKARRTSKNSRASTTTSHTESPVTNDAVPTVFISYSWDTPEHKEWVLRLAERLQEKGGVRIILDRWYLHLGGDRLHFMETSITRSDRVLVICTPDYAKKGDDRDGGVGYEAMIITSELAHEIKKEKFIPVLRAGGWNISLPTWLKSKIGADLQGDPFDEQQYDLLIRTLHQEHLAPPPVGPKPVFGTPNTRVAATPSGNDSNVHPDSKHISITDQLQRSPIAYAFYEMKGRDKSEMKAFVRPTDDTGTVVRFENSMEESLQGAKTQIAQRYLAFDLEMRQQGYTRMHSFNGSGERMFDLP
jgi:hypothetical protein